mmetsp:Transcript_12470/g.22616  ORF Transcript_12470/g.22616 Transcript_12470/m.22616 type:complete len:82 (+) Transcript_12470:239-484(+)
MFQPKCNTINSELSGNAINSERDIFKVSNVIVARVTKSLDYKIRCDDETFRNIMTVDKSKSRLVWSLRYYLVLESQPPLPI